MGWDKGLGSFFVYVANPLRADKRGRYDEANNGHVILYLGMGDLKITTVEELERKVARYADIPADVRENLIEDQRRAGEAGGRPTAKAR